MDTSHPLSHRDFRWLLAGRTVDAVGNAIAPIALGFGVLDLFGSVASLGLVVGAASFGNVLLVLVGGVVADRLPRTAVLIASNLVAAAVHLTMATLILTGTTILWPLVALGFAGGAAGAFDFPATAALVPQTVPGPALERANGLLRLSLSASFILGASFGGGLVALVGPGPALALDAATFVVATACYARIPARRLPRTGETSPLTEFVEGWHEFRARTWVWVVVVAFFFINAAWVGGFHVLGLAVADDSFGRTGWGLVVASESGGVLVGALVAGRLRPRRPLRLGQIAASALALPLLALAWRPTLALLLPVAFVAGAAITQFGIAWESSLQRHVPAERLARVASFDAIGSFSAIPIGEIVVGPLAEAHGTGVVLVACAAIVAVACAAALLSRDVRTLSGAAEPVGVS